MRLVGRRNIDGIHTLEKCVKFPAEGFQFMPAAEGSGAFLMGIVDCAGIDAAHIFCLRQKTGCDPPGAHHTQLKDRILMLSQ